MGRKKEPSALTDPDVGATSPSLPALLRPRERAGEEDAEGESGTSELLREAATAADATADMGPTDLLLTRELLGACLLEVLAAAAADASASAVARCRLRIAWNSSKVRDTI